MHVFTLVIGAQ